MAKPVPQGGLVIRYDYLWSSEEREGREEGSKDRPCAIVLTIPPTKSGRQRVVLCGITRTPPSASEEGVVIPPKVKRHLGLDDTRQSWAIVSEANLIGWEDPGVVPTETGQWSYGFLASILAGNLARRLLAHYHAGQLPLANRPKIEIERMQRDQSQNP